MKIGFIASTSGSTMYGKHYKTIVDYLIKHGHKVEHTLDISEDDLFLRSEDFREKFIREFYNKLDKVDIVISECSFPSVNVGYGICYVVQLAKPVIILHTIGTKKFHFWISDFVSAMDNVIVHSYEEGSLSETLEYALKIATQQIDRRFTMIFPAHLMNRLENLSKKKRIPKAVYIRQLLEKSLIEE